VDNEHAMGGSRAMPVGSPQQHAKAVGMGSRARILHHAREVFGCTLGGL
jgi:hypothetical protein